MSAFFNQATAATSTASGSTGTTPDFECPGVSVRAGAGTLSMSDGAAEDAAMNLRYQVGIGQTARECKLNGTTLTIRVGVQGRVILGPAGGPGQIELPLRMAVGHEGPEPKTIMTKLNRVAVTVPADNANIQFTMIEEGLSFPMPRAGLIDEYIIYVGFDPQGSREPAKRPQRTPSRRPPA